MMENCNQQFDPTLTAYAVQTIVSLIIVERLHASPLHCLLTLLCLEGVISLSFLSFLG